jgi:hypothetical protein
MAPAKFGGVCLHEQSLFVRSPLEKLSLLCMNKVWPRQYGSSKVCCLCWHMSKVRFAITKFALLNSAEQGLFMVSKLQETFAQVLAGKPSIFLELNKVCS